MTALNKNKVELKLLGDEDKADYAEFLRGNPRTLLYYGLSYKAFLEDLLGCESFYWMAREGGKITGILPIMRKSGRAGVVINSLPYFGSNGGVIAETETAERALIEKFEQLSSATDVASSTWISHPSKSSRKAL